MKTIIINYDQKILLDDEDFEKYKDYSWYIHGGYARTTLGGYGKTTIILTLHSLVLGHLTGYVIDHIDSNKLNNQKSNLRFVTRQQNNQHGSKRKDNSTGFIGVSFNKGKRKFQASISHNKKHIHVGYFLSPEEAALARDIKAKELHKEFANLNYP